jgi:hypothetical protein
MNLYFINKYGGEGLIAENVDMDSYYPILLADLMKRNPKFKMYYLHSWFAEDGSIMLDVGSHTEFYVLRDGSEL